MPQVTVRYRNPADEKGKPMGDAWLDDDALLHMRDVQKLTLDEIADANQEATRTVALPDGYRPHRYDVMLRIGDARKRRSASGRGDAP